MGKGLAIIGAGGFGREAYYHALGQLAHYGTQREIRFFADDAYANGDILPISSIDPKEWKAVIAIGDPQQRRAIVARLPHGLRYDVIVHPSANFVDSRVNREAYNLKGQDWIICAGAVLTTNITLGQHVHINLNATIGHDCHIGDFVTIAPSANISGNVTIGEGCYIGTNACIREKVTIEPNTIIGMGAVVLHDITEAGTYVGNPAKRIK